MPAIDHEALERATLAAVQAHVAAPARADGRPSWVTVHAPDGGTADDRRAASSANLPLTVFPVRARARPPRFDVVEVEDAAPAHLDLARILPFWGAITGARGWLGEALIAAMATRLFGRVIVPDPVAHERIRDRAVLYLANHQVMSESLLFSFVTSPLQGARIVALAKIEHERTWLGHLVREAFSWPGVTNPQPMALVDRSDQASVVRMLQTLGRELASNEKSVLVHVEGTRALSCRQPVTKTSSTLIDMVLRVGAPIVPVRFTGALPIEPAAERLDFPLGYGREDVWLGAPLLPEDLASVPYKERKDMVVAAINALGPGPERETPVAPDHDLVERVARIRRDAGLVESHAVMTALLETLPEPSRERHDLVAAVLRGVAIPADRPAAERAWLERVAVWLRGDTD